MLRDLDGRIEFGEDEEKALMLFAGHGRQYQLDKEYLSEMLSPDQSAIDQILAELLKNNILQSNERTSTYELTPYGRECASFLKARPGLNARQGDFLRKLSMGKADLNHGSGYADRYQAGMSISCSKMETDYICGALQSAGLIEPEMKEVTVFPGSGYERVRSTPTRRVRLTEAGINSIAGKDEARTSPEMEELKTEKSLKKPVESPSAVTEGLSSTTETDQAVESISGFLRSIVLAILGIALVVMVVFYK